MGICVPVMWRIPSITKLLAAYVMMFVMFEMCNRPVYYYFLLFFGFSIVIILNIYFLKLEKHYFI